MAKKLTHYKDTQTGQYVTKRTWQRGRAHGSERYKRTYERYTKPTEPRKKRTPTVPGIGGIDIPTVGRVVIRYEYKNKRGQVTQFEVEYVNGKTKSTRIGPRTYRQRASLIQLERLVNAARIVGRGHKGTLRRR